jgi:phosphatidylserine decarboxylase
MWTDYLKTLPQYIIPKAAITALAGAFAKVKIPAIKDFVISNFIRTYNVNMQEALQEDATQYSDFNDFFIRVLKPSCRPIAIADLVSPVDGCISEIGKIHQGQILQAKGHNYTVEALLTDKTLSQHFISGHFATLYLSPKDYHRVHMPIEGRLREIIKVPGKLFSVQPATARVVPQLFARNKRLVVLFDTSFGLMAMVLVGATIVGAIGTVWDGDLEISGSVKREDYSSMDKILVQAAEMGYFKLGSTVILLFANPSLNWRTDLTTGTAIRFGETLGSFPELSVTQA